MAKAMKLPKGTSAVLLGVITVFLGLMVYSMLKQLEKPKKDAEKEVVEIIRHVPIPIRPRRRHSRDFRRPPLRQYRPTNYEQLGLLTAPGQDSRALFGRTVEAHRDRFNYYTATLGNQSFPVPVSFNGQDCMDRYIGCAEIYGDNEDVVAKDNGVSYKAMMYQVN